MKHGYYLPSPGFHYLLSNLFLLGPSHEFISDLWNGLFPVFPDSFSGNYDLTEGHRMLFSLKERFKSEEDFYETFQDEFTELFLAPVRVYPYQSVYLDTINIGGIQMSGLLMGESTETVREFYTRYGFGKTVNLPDDHIAFELAFLGRLHSLYESTGLHRYLTAAREFVEKHLIRWVTRFCDDLYDTADLYKPVAKILKGLVLYEYEALMLTTGEQMEAFSYTKRHSHGGKREGRY